MCCRKVGAARIRDGRNADTPLLERERSHALEPLDASHAERFGVGHDMSLRHGHEIARTEITADLDLVLDRPPRSWAELTAAESFFLLVEFHLSAELGPCVSGERQQCRDRPGSLRKRSLALKNPAADLQH